MNDKDLHSDKTANIIIIVRSFKTQKQVNCTVNVNHVTHTLSCMEQESYETIILTQAYNPILKISSHLFNVDIKLQHYERWQCTRFYLLLGINIQCYSGRHILFHYTDIMINDLNSSTGHIDR